MQGLLRSQLAAQPPTGCGGASSSGRTAPCTAHAYRPAFQRTWSVVPGLAGSRRQNLLQPCRITSTSKELFQSKEAANMNMDDNGEDAYMDLPDYQVFEPEKGPLEKRVQRSFLDAVADDKVDLRDTEYWFSNPEGNWNSKPQRVYFMPEDEEPLTPHPWHPPGMEEGADERIVYSELEEGKVYVGMVTDVWLYHGVQVDLGAEFDGLIPCTEELWELAVDHIEVGEVVMVEIHKMRTAGLYRWPLQVKFCSKRLQDLMLSPDTYDPPVDHSWAEAQGWTHEQVAAATGRTLAVPTYFMPMDENDMAEEIMDGYGTGDMYWRESPSEPIEDYIDDPLENEPEKAMLGYREAEIESAAEDLLGAF